MKNKMNEMYLYILIGKCWIYTVKRKEQVVQYDLISRKRLYTSICEHNMHRKFLESSTVNSDYFWEPCWRFRVHAILFYMRFSSGNIFFSNIKSKERSQHLKLHVIDGNIYSLQWSFVCLSFLFQTNRTLKRVENKIRKLNP